jgi:isochorismate hydrolase
MAEMYWRVKRSPEEGSVSAAISCHAQACGIVAFVSNVHPDNVARAVADFARERAA